MSQIKVDNIQVILQLKEKNDKYPYFKKTEKSYGILRGDHYSYLYQGKCWNLYAKMNIS